ncbi:hypothetical protein CPS_1676 [Colwellia psychrerythraea 34H]|uniref:Uncharacterized protein n=1 Tax=Colwellia psychrerythraea (strain 34H / ATCC BAA-681) TaxID=167879 RepID=Q484V1_COLP3|nr:hypothetical protein CPS_1676 [Colwellia psychrerythraea 34H]
MNKMINPNNLDLILPQNILTLSKYFHLQFMALRAVLALFF